MYGSWKRKFNLKVGLGMKPAKDIDIVLPPALQEAGEKALKRQADFIYDESKKNIMIWGIIDTGELLRSAYIKKRANGWEVGYDAPWAMAVDRGVKPGSMPPVEAIYDWVMRRGMEPKNPKMNQWQLAWAISNAIKKHGQEARPFFSEVVARSRTQLKQLVKEEMEWSRKTGSIERALRTIFGPGQRKVYGSLGLTNLLKYAH
jgi:hypothetical protein